MRRTILAVPILMVVLSAGPVLAAGSSPPGGAPALRWETLTVDHDGTDASFELGRLSVPEDRSRPDGPRVELAFVRLPATGPDPGPPVVYLSGGPGQPSTPFVRSAGGVASLAPLRALGDVILLDQRGTGLSQPSLYCPPTGPPHPELFLGTEAAARDFRERFAACVASLEERGIDLLAYDTAASADDLEDLRVALGAEKLRLLGFSYGTHLALSAVRRHGESLDRVVLVGTEGPDHTWKLPATADGQISRLGLLAAAAPELPAEIGDLGRILESALRKLEAEPLKVSVPGRDGAEVEVPVGALGFRRILLQDLGDTSDLPWLPALIHQVERRETGLLRWFVAKRYRQFSGGIPAMYLAMDCASWVSPEREALIRAQARDALFGNVENELYDVVCPVLGDAVRLGDGFRAPVRSDVPVLLVSGTLDVKTPPFQAEEVRWGLSRGHHLVVENAGHEDLLTNPEVQRAIGEFLARGTVPTAAIVAPPLEFVPLATRER